MLQIVQDFAVTAEYRLVSLLQPLLSQHLAHSCNDFPLQYTRTGRSHCHPMHLIGDPHSTGDLLNLAGLLDFSQGNHCSN
ncbi:hypothetical protein D3C80_1765450 [compost metagenome]